MCYPKPGPRCSAHAKKALRKAVKSHRRQMSYASFEALKKAEQDYKSSPAGIKALEKQYQKTGSLVDLAHLESAKNRRQKALDELDNPTPKVWAGSFATSLDKAYKATLEAEPDEDSPAFESTFGNELAKEGLTAEKALESIPDRPDVLQSQLAQRAVEENTSEGSPDRRLAYQMAAFKLSSISSKVSRSRNQRSSTDPNFHAKEVHAQTEAFLEEEVEQARKYESEDRVKAWEEVRTLARWSKKKHERNIARQETLLTRARIAHAHEEAAVS